MIKCQVPRPVDIICLFIGGIPWGFGVNIGLDLVLIKKELFVKSCVIQEGISSTTRWWKTWIEKCMK